MAIFSDMPTEGEIEDLYGEFCLHDRNEQGLVDIHTMVTLMQNATDQKDFWDEEKVKQILDECDVTPCDEYEFEDYLTILTAHKRNTHYKQMELKLAEEDQDNQGRISVVSLKSKIQEMDKSFDEKDIEFWIEETGVDTEGKVDYKKFVEIYSK